MTRINVISAEAKNASDESLKPLNLGCFKQKLLPFFLINKY